MYRGRISAPGNVYFLTWVTAHRTPVFTESRASDSMKRALQWLHYDEDGHVHCATVMPDHVHTLVTLGNNLTIGHLIAKAKHLGRTGVPYPFCWQRDAFEHRLRPNESLEDYGLYVFLNPYRDGLVDFDTIWPGWWCPQPDIFRFLHMNDSSQTPRREWFEHLNRRIESMTTGE